MVEFDEPCRWLDSNADANTANTEIGTGGDSDADAYFYVDIAKKKQ